VDDFWHYLATVPMRDYPWWGLVLVFLVPMAMIGLLFGPTWWRTRPQSPKGHIEEES
jgi:hypothetical protein